MFLQVDTSFSIGETIVFECYDGYELKGSVSRTCMKNGRWNGTTTVCNSGCKCSSETSRMCLLRCVWMGIPKVQRPLCLQLYPNFTAERSGFLWTLPHS